MDNPEYSILGQPIAATTKRSDPLVCSLDDPRYCDYIGLFCFMRRLHVFADIVISYPLCGFAAPVQPAILLKYWA